MARFDHSIVISVHMKLNMEVLLEKMWEFLGMVRPTCQRCPLVNQSCVALALCACPLVLLPGIWLLCVGGSAMHWQVRIYTKKPGSPPDFSEPTVLTHGRYGFTVEAVCLQVGGPQSKAGVLCLPCSCVRHASVERGLTLCVCVPDLCADSQVLA
jgi:hypothetical protein